MVVYVWGSIVMGI